MCGISSNSKTLSPKPAYSYYRQFNTKTDTHLQFGTIRELITVNKIGRLRIVATLAIILLTCFNHKTTVSSESTSSIISEIHRKVPTGAVLHLFPRYGYLSLSMRVVPRNDSQNAWVFLEPTRDIFMGSTIHIEERSFSAPDNTLPIHNEFHIDLCEDTNQLVQAYFQKFSIQGLDKPWQAFAGGWRTPSLSKYFGIDPSFIVGDYRYMLVRVLMVRNSGKAEPLANATLTPEFAGKMDKFSPTVDRSMYHFANSVGTHYIHSYIIGNSIYQVFVYDAAGFDAVKRRLSEFNSQRASHISQLPGLLPLWGKQIGKLFILNSTPKVSNQIHDALNLEMFKNVIVPNIFKLHNNPSLVKQIESLLKNEHSGLLGMELKTIDIIFRDRVKKRWFTQSLKHLLHLWEINFQ